MEAEESLLVHGQLRSRVREDHLVVLKIQITAKHITMIVTA
jgi:hypothetical protein